VILNFRRFKMSDTCQHTKQKVPPMAEVQLVMPGISQLSGLCAFWLSPHFDYNIIAGCRAIFMRYPQLATPGFLQTLLGSSVCFSDRSPRFNRFYAFLLPYLLLQLDRSLPRPQFHHERTILQSIHSHENNYEIPRRGTIDFFSLFFAVSKSKCRVPNYSNYC
jgi:hypothetical protein